MTRDRGGRRQSLPCIDCRQPWFERWRRGGEGRGSAEVAAARSGDRLGVCSAIAAGLPGSMGRVSSALESSTIESFFGTLQLELLDRRRWRTGARRTARSGGP